MGTAFTVITTPGAGSLTIPTNSTLVKIGLYAGGSSAAYGTGGGAGGRDYLVCNYVAGTVINFYVGAGGLAKYGGNPGGGGGYTWAGPSPVVSYTYAPVRAKGGGTGSADKQVNVGYGPHGGHGHTVSAKTGGNGGSASFYGGAGGGAGGVNGNGGAGGYASAAAKGGGGGGAPSGGHAGYHTTTAAGAAGGNSFSGALGGAGGNPGPGARGAAGTGSGGGYLGASGANGSNGTDGLDGVHGPGGGAGAGGYNGGVGGSGGLFGGGGAAGGYITPPAGLDAINFGQFAPAGTQHPNNTTGTTVNGVTFHVATNYAGGFQSLYQTTGGWQGMFWTSVYSGAMIYNGKQNVANGTSPITLTFDTPISGLKHVAVQANDVGIFYGYMKAYNGATYLGGQQIVADNLFHANTIPPMFFGSGSANITKIVFSATNNSLGIGLGPCEAPSAGPGMGGNGGNGGIIFEFTTTGPTSWASSRIFPSRPPPPTPPPPPGPDINPKIASVNQVLRPLSQSATLTRTKNAMVAQTLPALTQASSAADTHGTRTGVISQTLGAVTQQAFGGVTHPPNTEIGSISQTLPGLTQSVTLTRTKTAPVSQALGQISQSVTATLTHGPRTGVIHQTLPPLTQSATGLVSPPPSPPPPPPPPIPLGVVKAGLQSVWNLRTTAGLNSALTHTLPANASSLPAGWTIGTEGASKAVNITAAGSVSNWDFTGYEVWIKASVAVGFTNCKFAGAGLNIGLHVPNGVNPAVTLSHCLFDGSGMTDFYGYICILAGTGAMSVSFTKFQNATQTCLWTSSTGAVSIQNSYFGAFAQGAPPQSHCDALYIETGVPTVLNCLFDATPTAQTTGGLTACLHTGPIGGVAAGANVTGNIFCGITALGLLYACQALGSGGDDVTYTGNVIQKGSGSWVVTGATVIDGGGNLDFNTASPIAL